jgi:hypothetical protein
MIYDSGLLLKIFSIWLAHALGSGMDSKNNKKKSIHSNFLFIICLKIKQSPMQTQAVNIYSLLLILFKRINNGFF